MRFFALIFLALVLVLPVHAADERLIKFTHLVSKYLDNNSLSSIPILLNDLEADLADLSGREDYKAAYKEARIIYLKQKSFCKSLTKFRSQKFAYTHNALVKQKLRNLKNYISKNRRLNEEEKLEAKTSLGTIHTLMQADLEIINSEIEATQVNLLQNPTSAGIYGMTSLIYGDCMPKSAGSANTCFETTNSMKVTIRKPATIDDLSDFVYLENKPELVSETESDENGFFEIDLEPGQYSIFVDDNGREYCNGFSQEGYACLIEITLSKKVLRNLIINHAFW